MALQLSSLQKIPISFATCSIGCRDEHTLPKKLDAIASAGFAAIELSMPDILSFASQQLQKEVGPYDYDDLVTASKAIKGICDAKGLKVLMLQPFSNFEGWAEGSSEREDAFRRARGWVRIMEAAGTDMLQVSSMATMYMHLGAHLLMENDRSDPLIPHPRKLEPIGSVSYQICASSQTCLLNTG